ncbi:MAG: hypothetical protein NUV98_03000 [Candidatus Roizmanbacteria bacterium]|nr:hypothetical protein [Candidatus Roizmanbacteria bacterium]
MTPIPAPIPVPRPPRRHNGIVFLIVFLCVFSLALLAAIGIVFYFTASTFNTLEEPIINSRSEPSTDEVTHEIALQLEQARDNSFSLHNNFTYLFQLEPSQEEFLGVAVPPEDATRVTAVRGIPFYETECRPFQENEITQLALFLNTLPKEVLELRPKGIVSACLDRLNLSLDPLTNALTSGPYIYLGDEFFSGTVFSGEHSENEKLTIFTHEYAHVLQYYYVHHYWLQRKRTNAYDYDISSTVVYDFARTVGWEQYPKDQEHSFFDGNYTWQLSKTSDAQMTTDYGKESGPTEDFAESFGLVAAGQPQTISEARKQYILHFLDAPESTFTRGVVPQYPSSIRVSFDYEEYLTSRINQLSVQGKTVTDTVQWGIDKFTPFDTIVNYYTNELIIRSFEPFSALTLQPGTYNDQFASGVYTADGKTYVVLVVGTITTDVTEVQTGENSSVIQRSTLTPEMYNVTVLTYE